MRRNKLYPLVALLASASASSAHAQSTMADVHPIKPIMMMLVDTSGSMELKPAATDAESALPNCAVTDQAKERHRWAYMVESLAGSYTTVTCNKISRNTYAGAFDEHYFLPHYEFTSEQRRNDDGVLDAYKQRFKFGLMTFDGVLTTINGATLVEHSAFESVKDDIAGKQGMYSYPPTAAGWKPLSFPGCTTVYGVNAGARAEGTEPGALISVGASDEAEAVASVNKRIQDSLTGYKKADGSTAPGIRPYGGTPTAAMLDDLQHYFENHVDVKLGSDNYFACRDRYALLLTDGAPDRLFRDDGRFNCQSAVGCPGGACQCPYDKEEEIAKRLIDKKLLKELWVVAFNVSDAAAMQKLNLIARNGSGDKLDAFRADTPADLRKEIDKLMNVAQTATSRSVPVVVNTGRALVLGGKQYEIVAGLAVSPTDDVPWEGRLFRRRVTCHEGSPAPQALSESEGDMFHLRLNAQSDTNRKIYFAGPKEESAITTATRGSLYSGQYENDSSSVVNLKKPNGNPLTEGPITSSGEPEQSRKEYEHKLRPLDRTMAPSYFGDADANLTPGEAEDRNRVVDFLRGLTTTRAARKLGAIYHSNPVVLPPVSNGSELLHSTDPRIRKYYDALTSPNVGAYRHYTKEDGRPGVIFVATNDGLLHAFNLEKWKYGSEVYEAGHEFWSFLPPALYGEMAAVVKPNSNPTFDGTPLVQDVFWSKGGKEMATVLIAPLRTKAAYVAFDVTYPEQPSFLWQLSFPFLGNTIGMPAIAHARVRWNGSTTVRSVAILPGGAGTSIDSEAGCQLDNDHRASQGRGWVRCWELQGRGLYVVDVETGKLLQEFDARHFPSPMTGSVAVDGEGMSLSQAAYMTDHDGVLWRLSMRTDDQNNWRAAPIWDLYAGEAKNFAKTSVAAGSTVAPIVKLFEAGRAATYPPLLARDPYTGNLNIVVGTGDVDNLLDEAPHRVVSLVETRRDPGLDELGINDIIKIKWSLQLDQGEQVTGPLSMLDDIVYFTTYKGPGRGSNNQCEMGVSRVVGAHVREETEPNSQFPRGGLLSEDGKSVVLQYRPKNADGTENGSLLLGLSIARDPICVSGQREADPISAGRVTGGVLGGGSYQMRTLVAGGLLGSTIPGASPTTAPGTPRMLTRSLSVPNHARSVGWASSIE